MHGQWNARDAARFRFARQRGGQVGSCALGCLRFLRFGKRVVLLLAVGVCASAVMADVILVPDAVSKQVYVLDPVTGDVDEDATLDISEFSKAPFEVVDGPGSSLLMSDHDRAMVFRLHGDGSYAEDYLDEYAPGIRGIEFLEGGLVGATHKGLFTWDLGGVLRTFHLKGDYFDIARLMPSALVATDTTEGEIEAYQIPTAKLLGVATCDEMISPSQVAGITIGTHPRVAVNSFDSQAVFIFKLNGELDYSFPLSAFGLGIIQLESGNLLVTATDGLSEYTVEGEFVRQILDGGGFRFLSRSEHFLR